MFAGCPFDLRGSLAYVCIAGVCLGSLIHCCNALEYRRAIMLDYDVVCDGRTYVFSRLYAICMGGKQHITEVFSTFEYITCIFVYTSTHMWVCIRGNVNVTY
jgi:hypothetical protein